MRSFVDRRPVICPEHCPASPYERFVGIQLVTIPLEVIFVNAIVDFSIPRKMGIVWTWTSVHPESQSVLVSLNVEIRLVHMIVLVLPDMNEKPKKLVTRKGISVFS